jgi:hypothetical protein
VPRYNLRNSLRDENVSGKLDPSDKERLEKEVEETIRWLDDNQLADVSCITGLMQASEEGRRFWSGSVMSDWSNKQRIDSGNKGGGGYSRVSKHKQLVVGNENLISCHSVCTGLKSRKVFCFIVGGWIDC